jgi:transglutaminase superfamily protein
VHAQFLTRRVTWLELRLFLRAQIELLYAQLLVWRRPIGRLVVRPLSEAKALLEEQDARPGVARIATAVDRAARRGVFRPRCLARSLALHGMLHRHGIADSVIRIGVRREGDVLLAHAWVEHRGVTLIDSPAAVSAFTLLTEAQLATVRPVTT